MSVASIRTARSLRSCSAARPGARRSPAAPKPSRQYRASAPCGPLKRGAASREHKRPEKLRSLMLPARQEQLLFLGKSDLHHLHFLAFRADLVHLHDVLGVVDDFDDIAALDFL